MLKEQRRDLNSGGAPPSPTTKGFIDENEMLQSQIQKKLTAIENVIDMLSTLIGEKISDRDDDENIAELEVDESLSLQHENVAVKQNKKKRSSHSSSSSDSTSGTTSSTSSSSSSSSSSENEDDNSSAERLKNKAIESMRAKQKEALKKETVAPTQGSVKVKTDLKTEEKKRFNYVFYDPEMHWCQPCEVFPKTAKDFLNHLHSKEHMDRDNIDTPWHTDMVNDQFPVYENAPTKRTPIRGLTFFVPATAWFCKLCSVWMGDLHCASSHLKSQLHSRRYNVFLEKNPHFEVNYLADRQRILNEKKSMPLPSQITSVSTTAAELKEKKVKKESQKSKKRKKKNSKDKKKKKKKNSKKRKKNVSTSSSTSSDSSLSDNDESKQKKEIPVVVKELDNPNPAASIRVAMRKQETVKSEEEIVQPPPPPLLTMPEPVLNQGGWVPIQETKKEQVIITEIPSSEALNKSNDDAIMQQWNTVQPVISESEKKLLEQLKGKLKNKPREESVSAAGMSVFDKADKDNIRKRTRESPKHDDDYDRSSRRSRSRTRGGRSRSRTRSRSRVRGRRPFYGRGRRSRSRSRGRRSRSRSRGRISPAWRGRRRRSRTRSPRRRSRSYDNRRSRSQNRVEKAVIVQPEFRPRVPEKDKEKEKKSSSKEKKEVTKSTKCSTTSSTVSKKLPFIGKMPVFKKQTGGAGENGEKSNDFLPENNDSSSAVVYNASMAPRPPAPTAAQIQMAMMEDAFGNAPPFHPDAGMIVDYDDLMPDPVQFVNLMNQVPPPPPPPHRQADNKNDENDDDESDILPPGIDSLENEEFTSKQLTDVPGTSETNSLPKEFEEALNIIFPGDKQSDDENDEERNKLEAAKSTGQTQIIIEEPVMQAEDLAKEGIQFITLEETSMAGLDEATKLSMNEPLVFNKSVMSVNEKHQSSSRNLENISRELATKPNKVAQKSSLSISIAKVTKNNGTQNEQNSSLDELYVKEFEDLTDIPEPEDIPMPESTTDDRTAEMVYDLDDIPKPPDSPTESEKNRRQEELDDLAMLGIDADDLAAQCM